MGDAEAEREVRCARAERAPEPAEIARRAAMERERRRVLAGRRVQVESLHLVGRQGDYQVYAAVLLASGDIDAINLQAACDGCERPLLPPD
jgi:hypothetical protein